MHSSRKPLIAIMLVMLLILINILSVSADDLEKNSDIKGHWAEKIMQQWVDEGLLSGFDEGVYLPDEKITRAQYITFINRVFNFTDEQDHNFTDINPIFWYAKEIKRAVSEKYIWGYLDGTMRPNDYITRIEAAVILTRLVDLEENLEAINNFTDYVEIPKWGINSVSATINGGLMSDFISDTFDSKVFMTRAESISALEKTRGFLEEKIIEALTIEEPGTYGPDEGMETYGQINIYTPGAILQNLIVENDLIIHEEVGDGEVTLDNVTVLNGNLIIRGGGLDSISINGGQYKSIRIENILEYGIRVVATNVLDEEGNPVDIVITKDANGGNVIIEGEFDEVVIEGPNVSIETKGDTKIKTLRLAKSANNTEINISSKTIIKVLDNLTGEGIIIKGPGKIGILKGIVYHVKSTSNNANASVSKQEYLVTIEGDAVETTDYMVIGANDLAKVEEGTILTIEAVSKIDVNGIDLEIGELTEVKVTEATTITINKQVEQVSPINITTNPFDTSGLEHNEGDVVVTLTTISESVEIYFTTDGSTPTAESTYYDGPFSVSNPDGINGGTITVKAIGIKEGMSSSTVAVKNIVYNYAEELIVNDALELVAAIENNNIKRVIFGQNITGDIVTTRLGSNSFSIDFGVYELEGSLNLTANSVLELDFNGSTNPSITGNLTVEASLATVTNNINVGGTITLNDVGKDSWNEEIDGNTIIIKDSNGATVVINGNPEDIKVTAGADGGINITANSPVIITVDEGATVSSITINETALGTTITNNGNIANVTANSDIVIDNNSSDITVEGNGIVGGSGAITGNNIVTRLTDLKIDQKELRINGITTANITTVISNYSYNVTSANPEIVSVDATTGFAITANSAGRTAVRVQVKNTQGDVTHQGTIFVRVLPELITAADIVVITPVLGEKPQTAVQVETATNNEDYTVTEVVWNEDLTEVGNFKAEETYSATITLASKNNKEFQTDSFTLTVSSATSVGAITTRGSGTGNKTSFTAIFPETGQLAVKDIEVTTQPIKMIYIEDSDDELTLEGMVVTEIYNDGTKNELTFTDNVHTQSIIVDPAIGTYLTNVDHDGQPIIITHIASGELANTDTLTVFPPNLTGRPPLGIDATLSNLAIGGITVSGFDSEKYNYLIELPSGTNAGDAAAIITAAANDENASVIINQATELPGDATIVVTAENGFTQQIYTINFTIAEMTSFEKIVEIHHQVEVPIDISTGLPTGIRRHQPFIVTTQINAETPSYYQMCVNGQTSNFIINYYRINEVGKEELYFTAELENVIIVGIQHNKFNILNPSNSVYPEMITLSFTYDSITWTYVIDGTIYEEDW